jgi:starvation-inducible DNA-binding protein
MFNLVKNEKDKVVIDGLCTVLSDTYSLYLKTQNFHWNVTGPRFGQLHEMFESQYREMADAIDEIAERIRALGHRAPGTFEEFLNNTSIKGSPEQLSSQEMITQLAQDHRLISSKVGEVATMAEENKDSATADMMISRLSVHDKTHWMLQSFSE